MYFDAFTISALVDEFMDTLVGGKIQDAIDVDLTGLGLEIYSNRQRHYLYMSADHQTPRIHLVGEKLRRGLPQPTQIGLLFRSYVENGIVTHVSQPPWERIMQIDIEGEKGEVSLIIEPMERRSNIILVQAGKILDSMRRVGPDDNRYRLTLPHHEYVPPPPLTGRLDPKEMNEDNFYQLFELIEDKKKTTVAKALSMQLLGMSPLLAKEIVFRASGNIDQKVMDVDCDLIYDAFQKVIKPLLNREWQSGYVTEDAFPAAYSAYPVTYMGEWQSTETMSAAVEAYYGEIVGVDAYNEAKKPVEAAVKEATIKLSSKLASLNRGLKDDSEREILKQSGELILAYQYGITSGQTELRAQYEVDEPELVIKLNTELTPLENAQNYFRKYEKAKSAQDDVPQMVEETQQELNYVEQLETDLENASNWVEIDDVIQALQARGYWLGKRMKRMGGGGRQAPLRIVSQDGYVVWIGRNSRQNEEVTFKNANGQDIWFHARDVPGAHVVIRNDGRRIKDELIAQAAAVAAYYSKKRGEGRVLVDYTRIKYVKSIKGAGPGMVTYRNEETITVEPQDEKILQNG